MSRIAVLGDSISQGMGRKKINYMAVLQQKMPNDEFHNFAVGATTIRYALEILPDILKYDPDIVVVFYGNVDAALRPDIYGEDQFVLRLPKRYRDFWMLDPRPFFSHKSIKRILQKIDSSCRVKAKKLLMKKHGAKPFIELDEFSSLYTELVSRLIRRGRGVILVSTVTIDDYYFPGSTQQYKEYNGAIQKVANHYHVRYVDLFTTLSAYSYKKICNYDHFHPNEYGYKIIGNIIAEEILKCRPEQEN